MKRILFGYFYAIILVTGCSNPNPLAQKKEDYVDSIMTSYYKPDGPGAVILVAKDGIPILRKAYGLANLELNVPNKPEYLFRIGSMSKQFTAVCILKLAQEGKLSLKDDIRKYLPNYNTHNRIINIENLLSHTSGIPSYTEKQDFGPKMVIDYSKEEMMRYFMGDSLLFEPGTDWSYSNSGYFLAGLIVEKAAGVSLEEYLQKNIFDPLDMRNTYIGTYEKLIPNAVGGYSPAGKNKFRPAEYLSWSWPYAAGEIITNVDDLLKWDNALYTEKIVKKEWLQKAWEPFIMINRQKTNYGFGWKSGSYNGLNLITHGGAINGFLSDGIRIPSEKLYIAVLSNTTSVSPSSYSYLIALRILDQPLIEPKISIADKITLHDYTGVYEVHRAGSRISTNLSSEKMFRYISIKNDTLFSQRTGGSKTLLLNIGKDLFISKGTTTFTKFHRDEKGGVFSLEIYDEPIQFGPNEIEPKTDIPLPKEKVAISIDLKKIEPFKGKYDFGGGFFIQITIEENKIYSQASGEEKEEIWPESDTKFFLKSVDATLEFIQDKESKVTGLILTQGGKYPAKKIE